MKPLITEVLYWLDGGTVLVKIEHDNKVSEIEFYQQALLEKYPDNPTPGSLVFNGTEVPIRSEEEKEVLQLLKSARFKENMDPYDKNAVLQKIAFVESQKYLEVSQLVQKLEMFKNRLLKVYKHKSKLARRQNVSCYRVYDHDLPEFPFAIELYEDKIYLAEYLRRHGMEEDEHDEWLKQCKEIISNITHISSGEIYDRQRRKMHHKGQQYEKLNVAEEFFTVEENGLKFLVNLTDYLDTGLFLDHRITRQMVREESKGKRVLNLFCYTGSFSVYAAAGEADSVTSVDLSKTYLKWAEDNMIINRFKDKSKYHFIHADVTQYLKTLQPNSFDLVVMDPPTFSNSKRMKDFLDIQRDHVELLNDVLNAITKNGVVYFSTNFTKFVLEKEKIKASEIKDITKATTPFDFEGKLKRWCYKITK